MVSPTPEKSESSREWARGMRSRTSDWGRPYRGTASQKTQSPVAR